MSADGNHSRIELVREINDLKDECVIAWGALPEPHRSAMIEAVIALADVARAAALADQDFTVPHFHPYLGPLAAG